MGRYVFVHRYRDSHVERRRRLKRMAKNGRAKLVERRADGWLYELTDSRGTRPEDHDAT